MSRAPSSVVAAPDHPRGIRAKLSKAFVLQAAAITCGTILGIYATSAVLEDVLIKRALEEEAKHYAALLIHDPAMLPPNTYNMKGFLVPEGKTAHEIGVPEPYLHLTLGFHSLRLSEVRPLVYVTDLPQGRLILKFDQQQVGRLAVLFGMIPLAFVLLMIYVSTLIAYRLSKRAVSPLLWLTNVVRDWDPRHPDPEALAPENLPDDFEGESQVLGDALYTYSKRIKELIERERNFTRDASHELRSPLTVIRIAADVLLDDGSLDSFGEKNVRRILHSARDMESLIESFLLLARDEDSGLVNEDVSINRLVRDELERAEALLRNKDVRVSYQPKAQLLLRAPAKVVSVLLSNLIRNACTYTDRGTVTVVVSEREVRVEDTGVGMSEAELSRAFQPFFRAHGTASSRSGHGVGLAIVKRLSDRFRWPVELRSTPGTGTTAIVRFPQARLATPEQGDDGI